METQVSIAGQIFSEPPSSFDWLPDFPTLASTRLQIELLLQEPQVDLRALAEVVLSDVSATLQIFRIVGEEFPVEEERPTRIEHCIASLNLERWHDLLCASGMPPKHALLLEFSQWRRVAVCARELAGLVDGFSPEEAYLVGLLSEVERLPKILGWEETGETPEQLFEAGLAMAEYWHLPHYLLTAIREKREQADHSQWNEMLIMARTLAEQSEPSFLS